jgi:hypothetical protein
MNATDIRRYSRLPRAELIEKIQEKTRGTAAHFTVTELRKMAVEELAALLVEVERRA